MKKRIEIELDENLLDDVTRCFPTTPEATAKLAELAITEWVGWLNGSARPTTLSQQNTERVLRIYSDIMGGTTPDARTLHSNFKLPLGQARYIVQSIAYQQAGPLYQRALEEISAAITSEMAKRDGLPSAEREAQRDINIRILATSESALTDVILELCYADDSVYRPKRDDQLGKYVYFVLRVRDVPAIQQAIEQRLKSL